MQRGLVRHEVWREAKRVKLVVLWRASLAFFLLANASAYAATRSAAETPRTEVKLLRLLPGARTESYELSCPSKPALCSASRSENGDLQVRRPVTAEKAHAIARNFFRALPVAENAHQGSGRAPDSILDPLVVWSGALAGKNLRGVISRQTNDPKSNPALRALLTFEAELSDLLQQ